MARCCLACRLHVASPKFIIMVSTILAMRKMLLLFVLYLYGTNLEEYALHEPQYINASFANYHYEYEILTYLNPSLCTGKKLFVFIISAVSSFDRRNIIRSTWAKKEHTKDSLVVFIVGRPTTLQHEMMVKREVLLHRDVVETTIPDNYNYTAFKVHAGYALHVRNCFNVPFVLRADDDIMVLPDRFVHFIESGHFGNPDKEVMFRYIPKKYYRPNRFPPYLNGPAYLMTRNSTKAILDKTNITSFFWIEDILFTGIMARHTHVKLIDSKGMFAFHCDQRTEEGRHTFRSWDGAGYCLRSTSACDRHGVPYATLIYHAPAIHATSMYNAYVDLTSVTCQRRKWFIEFF
uniref:Hexosyltransferase n=1 Tax=Steinernema glaseri TaxID=37863 RepID=A0A1I7YJ64_9BILA